MRAAITMEIIIYRNYYFRQVVESLLTVIGDNIPSLVNVVKEIAETLPDVQVR